MGKACRRGYKLCMPIVVLVCLPLAVIVVTQQRWLEALGALAVLGLVVSRRQGGRRAPEEAGSGTGAIDETRGNSAYPNGLNAAVRERASRSPSRALSNPMAAS